jgi:peptidoglycan-N-acetylglucosamine deacetylase
MVASVALLGFLSSSPAATSTQPRTFPVYRQALVLGLVADANGRVALTFDDCSDNHAWRAIIAELKALAAPSAFFCIGREVKAHPVTARRVVGSGSMLCNHSWSHPILTSLSAKNIDLQLRFARDIIFKRTGSACRFMRPPYGIYNHTVLQVAGRLGYRYAALWSVDPNDWRQPGEAVIVARVLAAARSGSIVLLHALPQTARALPAIVNGLRARGLRPVRLSRLVIIGTPSPGWWPPAAPS